MLDLHALIINDDRIQPEGRRAAIAASFQQMATIAAVATAYTASKEIVDVVVGAYAPIMEAREGDPPPVVARRQTLREVVRRIRGARDVEPVDDAAVVAWFEALIGVLSQSSDPRNRAMAETAQREFQEWKGIRGGL